MEAKHTPGPWRIKNITSRTGRSTASIVGPDNRGSLATVRVRYLQDDNLAEFAANAQLIAAAPYLLHGLEGLLDLSDCECDNTHEQNNTVCRVCWAQAVVDKIREAL